MREVIGTAIGNAHDELRMLNLQVSKCCSCSLLRTQELNDSQIWENPEVMFEEVQACALLANWFQQRGWNVKRGVYGISTSFEARFSVVSGGRTVCYNAEYGKLHPHQICVLHR